MRAFVHEPMKTTSIFCPASGCPASSPMYASAFASAARSRRVGRRPGRRARGPVMGMPMPGFVP